MIFIMYDQIYSRQLQREDNLSVLAVLQASEASNTCSIIYIYIYIYIHTYMLTDVQTHVHMSNQVGNTVFGLSRMTSQTDARRTTL